MRKLTSIGKSFCRRRFVKYIHFVLLNIMVLRYGTLNVTIFALSSDFPGTNICIIFFNNFLANVDR